MNRRKILQDMLDKLPNFYNSNNDHSNIQKIFNGFATEFDNIHSKMIFVQFSHYIDKSHGVDLDKIGYLVNCKREGENDDIFKKKIKYTANNFIGNATKEAIILKTKIFLNLGEGDFFRDEIITIEENPLDVKEFEIEKVYHNGVFLLSSNSIEDELFEISLIADESNEADIINPSLTDLERHISIGFDGTIKPGQKLQINTESGSVFVGGEPIQNNENYKNIKLLRKGSNWKFEEFISPSIARFDQGKFDENIFAINLPVCKVIVNLMAKLPCTFRINIPAYLLDKNSIDFLTLEKLINSVKAAGIDTIISIVEK